MNYRYVFKRIDAIDTLNIGCGVVLDKSTIRNLASLFFVQGVGYILPLLTLPYLVRTLGAESYGAFGFSLAFSQYFTLIVQYGFDLSATSKISIYKNDKEKVSEVFWSVIFCKLILAFLSFILMMLLVFVIPTLSSLKYIVIASFSSVLGTVFFPTWLFQGKNKVGEMAIYNIVSRSLVVPLIFVLVHAPTDAWLAALITGGGVIVSSILCLIIVYKNRWIGWCKPEYKQIQETILDGWHIFLSNLAGSLYINSIPVFLGFMVSPAMVGYYVAADKIRYALQGLMGPVTQVFYPKVCALMLSDRQRAISVIRGLLFIQSSFALLLSLLIYVFSEKLITVLYSVQYTNSILVLKILAPLLLIISVSNILGVQGMLTMGSRKSFSKIVWLGAILNTVLILPLIYYLNICGAAMSVLITEVIVMVLITFKTKKIWRSVR